MLVVDIDAITEDVIDMALRIHKELGPGLLETVYEVVLAAKLEKLGYSVKRQVPVSIKFEDLAFDGAFRVNILVNDILVIEVKSVEQLSGAHKKQLLTYLRLMTLPVGLLINFSGERLKDGLSRIVNQHCPSASSRLRVNQNSAPLRER